MLRRRHRPWPAGDVLELSNRFSRTRRRTGNCLVVACPMLPRELDMKQAAIEKRFGRATNNRRFYLSDCRNGPRLSASELGTERHFVAGAVAAQRRHERHVPIGRFRVLVGRTSRAPVDVEQVRGLPGAHGVALRRALQVHVLGPGQP